MLGIIKKLFGCNPKQKETEPLLLSNIEKLFESWSRGLSIPPSSDIDFKPEDIQGNYAITGCNSDAEGSTYFGTLALTPAGKMVKAYWQIGHTRQPQYGYGFVKGNLLALDFYYTDNGIRCYGQAIYRITNDRLAGVWRENNNSAIASENAALKNRMV